MPYRIFLVEDHPVMREAFASVLAREPDLDLCGEAETAEAALVALAESPCDLVVTDVGLPGMSGIDLVGHLQRARPGLPTLVMTGYESESVAQQARAAGATAFLPKSQAAEKLVDMIHAVLQSSDGAAVPSP